MVIVLLEQVQRSVPVDDQDDSDDEDDEDDSDDSDDEDDEDEEDPDTETITYQGVPYTLDSETSMAHDDELTEVGKWNGTKIKFLDEKQKKLHKSKVKELAT